MLNGGGPAHRELGVACTANEARDHRLRGRRRRRERCYGTVESDAERGRVLPHDGEVWIDLGEREIRGHAQ